MEEHKSRVTAESIEHERPADAADILEKLPLEEELDVVRKLDTEVAARLLGEMDPEDSARVIAAMAPERVAQIVEAMPPDEAADIIPHIQKLLRWELFDKLNPQTAATLKNLLQYPPDSAGGIMTPEVITVTEDMTVREAIERLRRLESQVEILYYVYVINNQQQLVGVLPMRELVLKDPQTPVRDIMVRDVVSIPVEMDREEAARIFARYKYYALPVVDSAGHLLGKITADDVIDVLNEEASEDIQKMAGAGGDEKVDSPIRFSFRKRLPWLQVNLATAFFASMVVGLFQDVLSRAAILAVFLPVVAGEGGNAGAQTLAVVIRAIALGEVSAKNIWRVMWRELCLSASTGLMIGLTAMAVVYLWVRQLSLALAIGGAMFINIVVACLGGAAIPLGLKAIGIDPAQSSSIFLTTLTDVVGFGTYLGLAAVIMKVF